MRDYFLLTARVGFSRWRADDLELAVSLWGQPDVTRYICASGVFSQAEIEARLRLELANQEKYGVQYFPVFSLADGDLIGCCGLRPCGSEAGVWELGFHLRKQYWGQGYGREAAEAMIRYAFASLGARELRAGHNPKNIGSQRLLGRLGFRYEGDEYYAPTGLRHPSYSMTKAEFAAQYGQ